VKAPAQYGTSIQTLATYLVEGQAVPYARASQLLQELLGVHLQASNIVALSQPAISSWLDWKQSSKQLW